MGSDIEVITVSDSDDEQVSCDSLGQSWMNVRLPMIANLHAILMIRQVNPKDVH